MIIATLPADEELRLADLASYDILNTTAESDFDELVELAGQICNCPISLITLLDKDRQWFKAKRGLEGPGTPKDVAFCAHAILQNEVMVVEDARDDARFYDNPLVTGQPDIRFYAGAPIVSPNGYNLGTICIIDKEPKKLSETEERALLLLSKQVTKLLGLRNNNKLLRERAEEIITLKSNIINRVIQVQEDDKKSIALTLHEDLAQSLASSLMYIKMAVDNKSNYLPLLEIAQGQLNDTLVNMRSLSNSIVPSALDWVPAEDLIKEFVNKIAPTVPFKIKIKVSGKDKGNANQALISIRVLEQWLKILGGKKDVSEVTIRLICGEQFNLLIEDNGLFTQFDNLKKEIFDSLIYNRVQAIGGLIEWSHLGSKNLLKIKLPVFAENNTFAAA